VLLDSDRLAATLGLALTAWPKLSAATQHKNFKSRTGFPRVTITSRRNFVMTGAAR
jgi:hypothetical protein